MRRFVASMVFVTALGSLASTSLCPTSANGQQVPASSGDGAPQLRKLAVPPEHASAIATKLSLQFRELPGVQISPDVKNKQLVVMAPESMHPGIAMEVQSMLASQLAASPTKDGRGPMMVTLKQITWREFEDDLQRLSDTPLAVTTSRNGERAAFQLVSAPMNGTTVEVDRRNNSVTVVAPSPAIPGWEKMIATLDQTRGVPNQVTSIIRLKEAEPAPIQRAIRLLKDLESRPNQTIAAAPMDNPSVFRNAVFQQAIAPQGANPQAGDAGAGEIPPAGEQDAAGGDAEGGAGVIGDTQIQFVPELGTIIIRGAKRDVERVMDVIKQIEEQSEVTKPDIQVIELQHTDANAVATLLSQLYEDVLAARQGEVSITSLDAPNALLLIGRTEAIRSLMDLIAKIDQPISESSRLRVFRLQHASAVDAEQTIRDFFTDRPGAGDDLRPALGARVRVLADYRTNSLIVSASPRDLDEVTRLINDLDVHQIAAQNQIKIFPLSNAIAEDLAEVLIAAIAGDDEATNENVTAASTTLSIVNLSGDDNQLIDSGVLAGAVITADSGANTIVVRAPSASMPLIGELIRQLDQAPGVESLVKVFTIENGDALRLTTALQDLFGDDAATNGTAIGAGNLAGLPPITAGGENSLVGLRFSADQRTNSIIASGSAEDLEVVESILIRLDSEGFAERITEVIWLRHQTANELATAIQTYVQQRTQTVNVIQQFQEGLGPFDLPDRDLIVVAEPATNSLLLSVSPRLYEDVRRLIDRLDRRAPMVLIKVLIAEVSLDDTFEIGGELGLQDSLVYDRGIAAGAFPGATPPSVPGFNFNNAGQPNANSFGQGNVAGRGLSSFGLGTTSSALGYGGFVLSAASDSVSLLLRTLQDANRLQILSRPQIMTMDNTEGFVQVGSQIARIRDVTQNVQGTLVSTEDIEVGLILRIRPRVGSDGLIVMDVDATRSARDTVNGTPIPAGDGSTVIIDDILRTTAQSVVAAYSGQTVVFGGLIQKERFQSSRRVPFLADIPLLGYFFKFERETERRSELLTVLTPMLVTGEEDMEYVKQTESARMSWCLADVVEMNGDVGLSGGYGLWGPATGGVIYPDLQPTVDSIINPDGTMVDPSTIDPSILRGAMQNGHRLQHGQIPYPGPTPYLEAEMGMPPAMGRTLPPAIDAGLPPRPQYYPRPGDASQGGFIPPPGIAPPVGSDPYLLPPMIDEQAPFQSAPFQPAPVQSAPLVPVPLELLPGELPQASLTPRRSVVPAQNLAEQNLAGQNVTGQVSWIPPTPQDQKAPKANKSRPIRIGVSE